MAWLNEALYYSDLGITDGSKVNNHAIPINTPQILRSGDSLQIGEYILLVGLIDVATNPAPPITLRCIQAIDQTPDVKTFRWVADATFDYRPGQFVTFQVTIAGQTVTRCYSISSSPSRPEILEFTVKHVGLVSNWLHETVGLGFELPILGIAGEFTCGGKGTIVPDKLLLLSAGSGMTPMRSIVRWLLSQLGLPASQYQEESFGGPSIVLAQPISPETNNVIEAVIEFVQSQKTIRPQTDESILDAGLRSGLKLKQGCRMGVCGVCKLKRNSGEVNYSRSPSGLQGDTSAFVLPCVACAVDRVVLEA